jgi:hypothetical protein
MKEPAGTGSDPVAYEAMNLLEFGSGLRQENP